MGPCRGWWLGRPGGRSGVAVMRGGNESRAGCGVLASCRVFETAVGVDAERADGSNGRADVVCGKTAGEDDG